MKTMPAAGAGTIAAKVTSAAPMVEGMLTPNKASASVGDDAGLKSMTALSGVATGPRFLTPTGTRNAAPTIPGIKAAAGAVGTIAITKGQRLPNYGSFSIMYNSAVVNFDVSPRVLDGVPMTPFRHLLEKAGGTVDWESASKSVRAFSDGQDIYLKIGDKVARINKLPVDLEIAPFLDRGRTIVPLSFIREALNVDVEFDKATGHVLITTAKK